MPRGGRPVRLVHDHRAHGPERPAQPGQVLVVVERVAAAPVHELDVRVAAALAVVGVGGARRQQHVGDPRDRDGGAHRVDQLRQRGRADPVDRHPDVGHRSVAVPEPGAGQPHPAQQRGEQHPRPHRLLAVLGALQRPAHRDHRVPGRHLAGQRDDRVRGHPADALRPPRGLLDAVGAAVEVGERLVGARAVRREEAGVVQALGDQNPAQRQHQRDVGAGPQRQPPGREPGGVVGPVRARQHHLAAAAHHLGEVADGAVPGDAAGGHREVLGRDAAETHEQLGVGGDQRPRGERAQQVAPAAEDPRQHHLGRADAVGVHRADVATEAVEEPVYLGLGVVEPPGARPAVGATEHGLRPRPAVHPGQLGGEPVEHRVPAHGDELVCATGHIRARPALPPTPAHHRRGDAEGVPQRADEVAEQRRRCGVQRVRPHRRDLAGRVDVGGEGAPVGHVRARPVHRSMVAAGTRRGRLRPDI